MLIFVSYRQWSVLILRLARHRILALMTIATVLIYRIPKAEMVGLAMNAAANINANVCRGMCLKMAIV
jgi:hypothetical protein